MLQVNSRNAISGEEALAILLGLVDLETLEQIDYVNSRGVSSVLQDLGLSNEESFEQIRACLTALSDELKKGQRSVFKLDYALSKGQDIYITLDSFRPWAIGRVLPARLPGGAQSSVSGSNPARADDATKPESLPKLRQQEDDILAEIRNQRFDPVALPARTIGNDWIKKAVREALDKSPPFEGSTTFDKAWDRLRKDGRIAEGPGSPPPK